MYEYVYAPAEAVVDPADGRLEVGTEVGGAAVENVEAVALEFVALRGVGVDAWEPRSVEHLYEGADGMRGE